MSDASIKFIERLASIKCIAYDFDGVMTDNRCLVDENGKEDGVCYVSHEEITQLCMNSSDENRVSILFQTNNIMK